MKQYTSKDQTAKLIELGFPKPKFSFPIEDNEHPDYVDEDDNSYSLVESYSIGELIEFLCPHLHTTIYRLELQKINECSWDVEVGDVNENNLDYQIEQELIDALFCACVTLKEEGVI